MKKHCLVYVLSLIGLSAGQSLSSETLSPPNFDEPMEFYSGCSANAIESCYVTGIGVITSDTPEKFRAHMESEGQYVYLSSPGGDLGAGIQLGKLIRENGNYTSIGDQFIRSQIDNNRLYNDNGEMIEEEEWRKLHPEYNSYREIYVCNSACAYAFLGGNVREIPDGAKLGFHQFSSTQIAIDAEVSQALSAQILEYVLQMGADARIFIAASGTPAEEMYYMSKEEAVEIGILPPPPFAELDLEPYGKGIVAFSMRQIPLEAYDATQQITFYCRDSQVPYLLLTAEGLENSTRSNLRFMPGVWTDSPGSITTDGVSFDLAPKSVTERSVSGAFLYETQLDVETADAIARAENVNVTVYRSRAERWDVRVNLSLNQKQRDNLNAVFRFCVS